MDRNAQQHCKAALYHNSAAELRRSSARVQRCSILSRYRYRANNLLYRNILTAAHFSTALVHCATVPCYGTAVVHYAALDIALHFTTALPTRTASQYCATELYH